MGVLPGIRAFGGFTVVVVVVISVVAWRCVVAVLADRAAVLGQTVVGRPLGLEE